MRFDAKNPQIWYYFIRSFLNIVVGHFLIKLLGIKKKGKKLQIVLLSHRLNGNIKALLDYINRDKPMDVDISYIAIDYNYAKKLARDYSKVRVLSTVRLKDTMRVLNSDVIVTTHGPSILYYIRKFQKKRPKFVDVWHGVSYKGLIPEDFKMYHMYDRICAPSLYFRDFYVNKWGFKDSQVRVTGWGRVDYYFNNSLDKKELLKKYNLNKGYKSIILYTPTHMSDDKNRKLFPFGIEASDFLDQMNAIGKKKNALFIFRTHVNDIFRHTQKYKNVVFLPQEKMPRTYELLYIADILVVDWSSIVNDFLTLNRPTIHLNVKEPYQHGFTFEPKDRVGYIVNNMNELSSQIEYCIDKPDEFKTKFKKHRDEVLKLAYDKNLDGNSAKRYLEEIRKLF